MFYGYIYITLDQKENLRYVGQKSGLPEESPDYFGSGDIMRDIIKSRGTFFCKKRILGIKSTETLKELKQKLDEAETECIYFFRTYSANGLPPKDKIYGYNLTIKGSSVLGSRRTPEQNQQNRQRRVQYNKEHPQQIEKHKKNISIPVLQFSLQGEYIRTWESGKQASNELQINHCSIWRCCQGNYVTAGGFIFKYQDDIFCQYTTEIRKKIIQSLFNKLQQNKKNQHKKQKKPILQFDKNMIFLKDWNSAQDAIKILKMKSSHHIYGCCHGERKTAYNFIWRHKSEFYPLLYLPFTP